MGGANSCDYEYHWQLSTLHALKERQKLFVVWRASRPVVFRSHLPHVSHVRGVQLAVSKVGPSAVCTVYEKLLSVLLY